MVTPRSSCTATVVFAKVGMMAPARVPRASVPSSTNCMTATLVSALVCEAMRKMVSGVIRRPASLSAQPNAFSYSILPWRITTATRPATRLSST